MFDNKTYQKDWYIKNKEVHLGRAKIRNGKQKLINQSNLVEYLNTHPCVDCGETDIVVLQFDHVRGVKIDSVSNMIKNVSSWETIFKEIQKCDIRCANDHARKTARQQKNFKISVLSSK